MKIQLRIQCVGKIDGRPVWLKIGNGGRNGQLGI